MKRFPSIRGCSLIPFLMILSVSTAHASGSTSTSGPVGPVAPDACAGFGADWVKIRTEADLGRMINQEGKYVLCNDITLTRPFIARPLGSPFFPFFGEFDGNNFEIRNLRMSTPATSGQLSFGGGLFSRLTVGAVIKNLRLNGVSASGQLAGAVAGDCYGAEIINVTVSNANISASPSTDDYFGIQEGMAGGVVGAMGERCKLTNVMVNGTSAISGEVRVGGIAGVLFNGSVIENSIVDSQVHVGARQGGAGGVAALVYDAAIRNSQSFATVDTLNNSNSFGVGGLVGDLRGEVLNSHAYGNVTATAAGAGGLVGIIRVNNSVCSVVSGSSAHGNVSAFDLAGGLVGQTYRSNSIPEGTSVCQSLIRVEQSYSTGDVSSMVGVGGLFGRAGFARVTDSFSTSEVKGNNHTGGLVGELNNDSVFHRTHFYGSVGGLIGNLACVGGIAGSVERSDGYTGYSYNNHLNYTTSAGSSAPSRVLNSLYLNTASTESPYCSTGGLGITAANMTRLATFRDLGWSISGSSSGSTTWRLDTSIAPFPTLRSNPYFFNITTEVCVQGVCF